MSDCVEWHKSCQPSGYGQTFRDGRVVYAHRVAYEDAHGPIPDGLTVHHTCGRRNCVNVEHLVLLERAEHSGRLGGHGKLTRGDAERLRQRRREGLLHRELAEEFGVSRSLVSMILAGKRWG